MAPTGSMIHARIAILALSSAQWLLIWCVRYLNLLPITRSLQGAIAALVGAGTVLGVWVAQGKMYRSMTGINLPMRDNYFFAVVIGEAVVSLCILFFVAFELRREQNLTSGQ